MKLSAPVSLDILGVAGRSADDLYMRAFRKSESGTILEATLVIRGSASGFEVLRAIDEECTDLLVTPGGDVLFLGRFGNLYRFDGTRWLGGSGQLEPVEYLNSLRWIDDVPFAVGTGSRLLRWADTHWDVIPVPSENINLLGLAPMRTRGFLLTGSDGFLAQYVGLRGERLQLPTNCDINAVDISPDATIALVGERGTLFVGHPGFLADLSAPERETDFVAVQFWRDRFFVAAETHILVVTDHGLREEAELNSFYLTVIDGELYCLSSSGLHWFSGERWRRIDVTVEVADDRPKRPRRKI